MPQVEGGPAGLNRILEGAYSSAISSGKDKGTASAIAWSAAKDKYKKKGDQWVRKLYDELAELCKAASEPAFNGDRELIRFAGSACIREYAELSKQSKPTPEDTKPSFTGESGPIWDASGKPLLGTRKFLGPLGDAVEVLSKIVKGGPGSGRHPEGKSKDKDIAYLAENKAYMKSDAYEAAISRAANAYGTTPEKLHDEVENYNKDQEPADDKVTERELHPRPEDVHDLGVKEE